MVKHAVLMGGAIATLMFGGTLSSLFLSASPIQAQSPASAVVIKLWQGLTGNNVAAKPGDVLRFTLKAENKGDRPAKQLVLAQPIPQGTVYVLNTAISESPASIIYSIDGGKTFVAKPTVKVSLPNGTIEERPAPAEAYTHVRWLLGRDLSPKSSKKVFYQVRVKS
jgi:uncharacterized repeat protein (TIGR01451 family)